MQVDVNKSESHVVAALSGSFDAGDERMIVERIQPLAAEPEARLLIDLAGLESINSLGLSELINVVVRSRLNRSRVVLVAPKGFVRGVFEMTRLSSWFEMYEDVDSAAQKLSQ